MWRKYFKFVRLVPGRVIVQGHGEIDFSRDDIPVDLCMKLYEADFLYLEITELGKEELYGLKKEVVVPEQEQEPELPPQVRPPNPPKGGGKKKRMKTKPDKD